MVGIKIGIISPNLPNRPIKTTMDSTFLWFQEIEAAWAYLLSNQLEELYLHPDISELGVTRKYQAMLKELHHDINISTLLPDEPLKEMLHFPKLEEIFTKGQVKSLYQPIIDASKDEIFIHGIECLSRFVFDERNLSPEFIFNYAQEKLSVTYYDRACIEQAISLAPGQSGLIFINVRPQTLVSFDFNQWLLNLLKKYRLSHDQVVMEITEQQCHVREQAIKEQCQKMSSLGIRLALDDFGSGLANLSMLEAIKPNYLKIAGRFSKNIHKDQDRQKIIKNILDLAHSFDIAPVVECVESKEEWLELKRLGATLAQGFYFFHPMPKDEIKKIR